MGAPFASSMDLAEGWNLQPGSGSNTVSDVKNLLAPDFVVRTGYDEVNFKAAVQTEEVLYQAKIIKDHQRYQRQFSKTISSTNHHKPPSSTKLYY